MYVCMYFFASTSAIHRRPQSIVDATLPHPRQVPVDGVSGPVSVLDGFGEGGALGRGHCPADGPRVPTRDGITVHTLEIAI